MKLTTESKVLLEKYVRKWDKIFHRTDKASRKHAEHAIYEIYGLCEWKRPKKIHWFDSPYAASVASDTLRCVNDKGEMDYKYVNQAIFLTSRASHRSGQLSFEMGKKCSWLENDIIKSRLMDKFHTQGENINNSIYWALKDHRQREAANKPLIDGVSGNLSASSVAPVDFAFHELGFREQCEIIEEVDTSKDLTNHCLSAIDFAQYVHWSILGTDDVFISEFPTSIKQDIDGLLHCESGPALSYADGFSLHSWHGNKIPARWTEPGGITSKEIISLSDSSLLATAIQIMGWYDYTSIFNPIPIEPEPEKNNAFGRLIAVDIPNRRGSKFLVSTDSQEKPVATPVPKKIRTAREARKWLDIQIVKKTISA